MKNYLVLAFALVSFLSNAQNVLASTASVEKNLFSIQLGIGNLSVQNETLLLPRLALHTEFGLGVLFSTIKSNNPAIENRTATIVSPYITVEPRWYYNIENRLKKGKNIKGNSASYITIQTKYRGNDAPIVKKGDFNIVPDFSIIPKLGIRRTFAKQFNYEFSGGMGYQYNIFSSSKGCNCSHNVTALDLQARIGYNF